MSALTAHDTLDLVRDGACRILREAALSAARLGADRENHWQTHPCTDLALGFEVGTRAAIDHQVEAS